jgi:hypothetical protein
MIFKKKIASTLKTGTFGYPERICQATGTVELKPVTIPEKWDVWQHWLFLKMEPGSELSPFNKWSDIQQCGIPLQTLALKSCNQLFSNSQLSQVGLAPNRPTPCPCI